MWRFKPYLSNERVSELPQHRRPHREDDDLAWRHRTSQEPRLTPIIWTAPDFTSASRLAATSGSRRSVGAPGGSVPGVEGLGLGGGGGGGGLRLGGGDRGGGLRTTGGEGGGGLRLTGGEGGGGLGLGDGGGGGLRLGGGGELGLGGCGGGDASDDAGRASSMPCA